MNSQQHPTHSLSTPRHNPYPSLSDVANRHVGNQGTFRPLNDENIPPNQASQPGSPWSTHPSVPYTPKANEPIQRTPLNPLHRTSSGFLSELYSPSPFIDSRSEIEVRTVQVNAGIPQEAAWLFTSLTMHMTPEQRVIAQQGHHAAVLQMLKTQAETLACILDLVRRYYVLDKPVEKVLTDLLKHYFVKPLNSYDRVYDAVELMFPGICQTHIMQIGLPLYNKEPCVRASVNKFLTTQHPEIKITFRNAVSLHHYEVISPHLTGLLSSYVFDSIGKRIPLGVFANQMKDKWEYKPELEPLAQSMMASLAHAHRVGVPVYKKVMEKKAAAAAARAQGIKVSPDRGSTGFWEAFEDELQMLQIAKWENDIISGDTIGQVAIVPTNAPQEMMDTEGPAQSGVSGIPDVQPAQPAPEPEPLPSATASLGQPTA
ncbi:hypothetical protein M422DRAFT_247991 [Sphaerobolus stellatus SS14]|nr:hypothetical protein M422DRAFT_247991 [Sphaerobolus stellatus SS14]